MYIKKYTKPSKCTLPGFCENNTNLCTTKLKYALVEKKINQRYNTIYVVDF